MKKPVDIEDLLAWAYRDQRVGEVLGGGVPLRGAIEREPMGSSRDGVIMMERLGLLGCAVQGGGARGAGEVARDAETVFEVVAGLTGGARPGLRALIRTHAAAGTVPDWVPHPRPKCFALHGTYTDGRGRRHAHEYQTDRASGLGDRPYFALVGYRDMPEAVAEKRMVYAAWREALDVLATYFRRHHTLLTDHVVTGLRRSPAPWDEISLDRRHSP